MVPIGWHLGVVPQSGARIWTPNNRSWGHPNNDHKFAEPATCRPDQRYMRLPKNQGPFLGVPITRIIVVITHSDLFWGPLFMKTSTWTPLSWGHDLRRLLGRRPDPSLARWGLSAARRADLGRSGVIPDGPIYIYIYIHILHISSKSTNSNVVIMTLVDVCSVWRFAGRSRWRYMSGSQYYS